MIGGGDYTGLIGPVARDLCGDPNPKLSSANELRFGTHGSLSVDLVKDVWHDHESDEGGGVLALVTRYTGRHDGKQWLIESGHLQPDAPRSASPATEYNYTNEHGEILFQVLRRDGHKFSQRRPDASGEWVYKVAGVRQVPYRLPELITHPDDVVFVVEGEKDVDNLRAVGLLATCNAGGAGKWRDHHSEHLRGRDVVILPDNDVEGRKHADKVRESLAGIARSVRVLQLPGLAVKGDVSDWLAAGGTGEALVAMLPDQVDDDDAPEPRLTPVDLLAFMQADPEPPEFVLHPIIPRGVPTLLGAHGGAGKTMLAQIIAAHVACGRSWAGFTVERGAVVFVSLEDRSALMRYRLRKIVECYGLDAEAVAGNLQIFDGTDVDGALMSEVNDHGTRTMIPTPIMLEVEEAARGATLVIVDNASDGFDGDENNRRQVRAFMRRLSGIAKANNAGMVLLAHVDKAAARFSSHGNSYSGSTAWHNSARSRLAMLADDDGVIELIHEKCNLAKLADPVRLAWSESGVLVPSKADPAADGASDEMLAKADAEHVLGVVKAAIEAGITVPTAASGPSTSWHALQHLPELAQVYRAKDGKRRVHAALIRLGREGTIVRGTFKTSYRNDRECWTLPDYRTSGESLATKSAAHISPSTPTALPQRRKRAAVVVDGTTPATPATPAKEDCPRCDGEGCRHCAEVVL